jgi:hypothetical protein
MADIKVNIDVNDNGSTAKVVKNTKELTNALADAAVSAKRTNSALVDAHKATYISNKMRGVDTSKDSSIARSAGSGTGSDTRDFSKQAQGLGGLVHVYATFAANLYAVGAAFNFLSKAADTANLMKGLDQLGASSGRNLGNVAKQMVQVTDGALSLKDAMTSTA